MQKKLAGAALAGLLLTWTGEVAAQDRATSAPAGATAENIEVLGQRRLNRKEIFGSVRSMAAQRAVNDVVPRYFDAICPKVVGIRGKGAQLIEARISAVADYVGLPKAKEKCRTNAVILILDQPPEMFEVVVKKRFGLIGLNEYRDLHLDAIRNDLKAGKPLVAWNQIADRGYDGPTFGGGGFLTGSGALDFGFVVTRSPFASRLRSSIYRAKQISVVVFDKKQLAEVDPIQLADLASIYLLGSPRRKIEFDKLEAPSLLTLFRDGAKRSPGEMTDFDRAYLKGLYAMRPNDWANRMYRTTLAAYRKQCTEEGVPCPSPNPGSAN